MKLSQLCGLKSAAIILALLFSAHSLCRGQASEMMNPKAASADAAQARTWKPDVFSKSNLVAWCIVPFDIKKRGPEARAAMLDQLGITKLAYDWWPVNIPSFDAEVDAERAHHIQIVAWWLPAGDDPAQDPEVQAVLSLLQRKHLKVQLWVMYTPGKDFASLTQHEKVARAAATISYLASEAQKTGSSVGLYNHGGWWGEPENELAVLSKVDRQNVGIVYNFNHAQKPDRTISLLFS